VVEVEFVKHHVKASGSESLKGFFASDNVKYDPDSKSLRTNIQKAKCKFVFSLASGHTDEDEEHAIRDAMVGSENSYELIRMFFAMRGWSGLDDELEEAYLDPIARQLAQVLDQRDYPVYKLIRRHLAIVDYDAAPNLGDCFLKVLRWPAQFQPAEFDAILATKGDLLGSIAGATLRGRTSMVDAAWVSPEDVIKAFDQGAPPGKDDLIRLMHQINYTTRICLSLARLEYSDLYDVLLELADPNITDARRRQACRDALVGLSLEFAAAERAVKYAGSNEAKSTVGRFMVARKAVLDAFAPAAPPGGILAALKAILAPAANTLAELKTAVINLPDKLTEALTLSSLLGSDQDELAVQMIHEADAQKWLPHMSSAIKVRLINSCMAGGDIISGVVDAEEIAINTVLSAAKAHEQAELYQLAAAVSWEALDSAIDGEEHDDLERLLSQPV
jgi:hypothetical protein